MTSLGVFFFVPIWALCFGHLVAAESDSSTKGIDIPYIKATSACSRKQQPQVESNVLYSYLLSPAPDQVTNQTEFNCTWLIQVRPNQTVKSTIKYLELTGSLRVDFFDGPSENSVLLGGYTGRVVGAFFQTKSTQLFIRYYGDSRLTWTSAFHVYLEESAAAVWCTNGTTSCRDGLKCFTTSQKCNKIYDCKDGTDEEDCPGTNLTFSSGCGHKNEHSEIDVRVVGGKASIPNSWPWMVSLRLAANEPDGHTCGASIINRKFLITAAHCMRAYPNIKDWTVNAGKYQKLVRDDTEVVRYIKRAVVHEHFIGDDQQIDGRNLTWYDYNANDIAIIELNAPLPDDQPAIGAICLSSEAFPIADGLASYVLGWGTTYETGNDLVLKEAIVPVISNEQCRNWMPQYNIGPRMLCAGYETGGQDACQGDSGGPLLVLNANTFRYDQIGIVSTGDVCGGRREAGIYTHIPSFVSWIRNITSAYFEA